jgi:dCTP deaminase
MILSPQEIRARAIMHPFSERTVSRTGMSYGLSHAGYDVRIDQDFVMWPGRCVLASTVERFDMPSDVVGQVADKSTWARRFITMQNTVIEPGWKGFLTLEIINHSLRFVRIRKGDPIAQILFVQMTAPTERPYEGKYQNQERGPQKARRELAEVA